MPGGGAEGRPQNVWGLQWDWGFRLSLFQLRALPRASVSSPVTWGEWQCLPPAFEGEPCRKCAQVARGKGLRKGAMETGRV